MDPVTKEIPDDRLTACVQHRSRSWQHWFGDPRRPLAGWIHLPAHTLRGAAVVLCNPFGTEMMSSRRAYRHLAEVLAGAGFPVLRFDYDGTGDSAGSDDDPGRVDAWITSIHAAVDETRRLCGPGQVVLFGVRLGALLARTYAATHQVGGLILMACPASGSSLLRELRALEKLRSSASPVPADAEEIAGFPMSNETVATLSGLNARTLPLTGAPHVLVVSSDQIRSQEKDVVEGLTAASARTAFCRKPGYESMMREDPYACVVPVRVWRDIRTWLAARWPVTVETPTGKSIRAPALVSRSPAIGEELVSFAGMHGVMTEPASGGGAGPDVLLLNVGANHHIGTARLYVTLARHWAARGYRVLRFDRPGIGDSATTVPAKENVIYSPDGVEHVRAAMDFLERRKGTREFVLAGLCSGAYFAYRTGLVDPRVVGLLLVNVLVFDYQHGDSLVTQAQAFKSTRFYARRLFDRGTIRRLRRGEVRTVAVGRELAVRTLASALGGARRLIRIDPILRSFQQLDAWGINVLLIAGHDDAGVDMVEKHLGLRGRGMRHSPRFAMKVIEGADHTFTSTASRQVLREVLTHHLEQTYPIPRPSA